MLIDPGWGFATLEEISMSFSHSMPKLRYAVVALSLALHSAALQAQSAKKPKAVDNQPPAGAISARMMTLIHEGKTRVARSQGASYLSLHPGTPRTIEHCHILVAFAYADLLLEKRDEATQALAAFDKGCKHTAVRDDYRAEVVRVKRVLGGEALTTVYPR